MLLPILGHVGGEDVIEAAILSDDHDDVLDRRCWSAESRECSGWEAALAKGAPIVNWNMARPASPMRK